MALIRNRLKTRFFRNLANKNIQAFEQKAHEILIVAVNVMRSDELTKLPAPTSRIVIIAVRTFFLSFVGSWHNIGYSAIFHGCLNVFRRGFQPLYINRIAFFSVVISNATPGDSKNSIIATTKCVVPSPLYII